MGTVILGVTISLDGFAENPTGSVSPLFPDLVSLAENNVMQESICTTGAVVMTWKEFAMADDPDLYAGNYDYEVPNFVVSDRTPYTQPKETDELTFTFVTDGIESAGRQAKSAAGKKMLRSLAAWSRRGNSS